MAISEIEQRISDLVFPPILGDNTLLFVAERLLLSPLTILLSHSSFLSFNNHLCLHILSWWVFNKSQLNALRQKARNQPGLNNLMRKTNINVKADPIKTCFPSRVCVRMYGSLPNTLSMSGL